MFQNIECLVEIPIKINQQGINRYLKNLIFPFQQYIESLHINLTKTYNLLYRLFPVRGEVGLLLVHSYVLGNEAYANRNGMLDEGTDHS